MEVIVSVTVSPALGMVNAVGQTDSFIINPFLLTLPSEVSAPSPTLTDAATAAAGYELPSCKYALHHAPASARNRYVPAFGAANDTRAVPPELHISN